MFHIIIFCIILLFIIFHIYIKILSKFWCYMPLFFKYKIYYWITTPKIIYEKETFPIINKFINNKNIFCDTLCENELTNNYKFIVLQFIKRNYIHNKIFTNDIHTNNNNNLFFSQYYGHIESCYISKYSNLDYQYNKIINGILLNRPFTIKNKTNKIKTNLFEFLSIKRNKDSKKTTTELIYNAGLKLFSKTFPHCIFKTYRNISNVYPFLTYYEYIFNIKYFTNKPYDKFYKLNCINDSNFNLLNDTFETNLNNIFETILTTEITNIYQLIKYKNYHLFIVSFNNIISSIYIFKDFQIKYNNKKIYDLISSILLIKNDFHINLFVNNFYNCIDFLKKKNNIEYINIHNVSNNNILLRMLKKNYKEEHKLHTNWYNVNYIMKPIECYKTITIY
jgi:hypothetical protein